MTTREIVTSFESREVFMDMIKVNPGHIVVKLGATWCPPCKRIESAVHNFFIRCPDNVVCCDIDVDGSSDMYAFLKAKKMVNGIPAVLVYSKGNDSFIPDDSHMGGDVKIFGAFASAMLAKFNK